MTSKTYPQRRDQFFGELDNSPKSPPDTLRPTRRAGVLKDEVTTVQNRGAKERHCYEATRPGCESNSPSMHSIQIVHPEAHKAFENCLSTSTSYTVMM